MTRVLLFTPEFRPTIAGGARQAEKLARALPGKGCAVEVLTPRLNDSWPLREGSLSRYPLRRFPGLPGLGILERFMATTREVRRRLGDFDVLHVQLATDLGAYAAAAALAAGKPVLCQPGSSGEGFDLARLKRFPLLGRLWTGLLSGVDRWCAVSGAVRAALIEHGVPGERIADVPNGVVLDPKPSPALLARKFLYLGRLDRASGRDLPALLEAFDRVGDSVPDAELALVGGGDLLGPIRESAARLRHGGRARVPGFADSRTWLHWADCLVLPSRREGLSNSLLEGMAAGLACVANDIPPNREALCGGSAGVLVPVGDAKALARALLSLATEPSSAERLGRAALERAGSAYDMGKVAERFAALYAGLIAAKR